jgi:hypothetical protein
MNYVLQIVKETTLDFSGKTEKDTRNSARLSNNSQTTYRKQLGKQPQNKKTS